VKAKLTENSGAQSNLKQLTLNFVIKSQICTCFSVSCRQRCQGELSGLPRAQGLKETRQKGIKKGQVEKAFNTNTLDGAAGEGAAGKVRDSAQLKI
jgi:hypothetical protein